MKLYSELLTSGPGFEFRSLNRKGPNLAIVKAVSYGHVFLGAIPKFYLCSVEGEGDRMCECVFITRNKNMSVKHEKSKRSAHFVKRRGLLRKWEVEKDNN